MSPLVMTAWVVGLALVTAVLAAAEGALFSLSRADREALATDSGRFAAILRDLLEAPRHFLFDLQMAVEIGLVAVALAVADWEIHRQGLGRTWWILAVAPPILLFGCIILPRAIATRHPKPVALMLVAPLKTIFFLLRPVLWPLKQLNDLMLTSLGVPIHGAYRLDETEFKTLVEIGEKEGTLGEQERELIHNVFEFGDIVASEVMTPRTEVIGFSINTPVERIARELKEHRLSRVPIFKTNLDNVLGILYTKDLLALRVRGEAGKRSLKELLRPVYFVPVTKKVDELFREFQRQKIHLAVVVDEYGGVAGIVTMDDLLEELFGVMLAEHDEEETMFIALPDGSFRVQAQMDLEEFQTVMGLTRTSELADEVNTVGGYLLALAGTLPNAGDTVRDHELEFVPEKLEGARLVTLRVRRLPQSAAPSLESGEEDA